MPKGKWQCKVCKPAQPAAAPKAPTGHAKKRSMPKPKASKKGKPKRARTERPCGAVGIGDMVPTHLSFHQQLSAAMEASRRDAEKKARVERRAAAHPKNLAVPPSKLVSTATSAGPAGLAPDIAPCIE